MKKFNLSKKASSSDFTISEKSLDKNRNDMNLSNDQQDIVSKNINFSIPKKDRDNTIPFNQQLEASRKNKSEFAITEASMSDKIVDFKSKNKVQVMDINVESRKFLDKQSEAYKKAEKSSKEDTEFWDKYVGVQLEGEMKNISNNVPSSGSQLQNSPDRFNGEKIDKMVMASIKDADAMIFHIFATASQYDRELNEEEKQQIIDINSGKAKLLAQSMGIVRKQDPIIRKENGSAGVYDSNGVKIDEFKSCEEAKANYPEGDIV